MNFDCDRERFPFNFGYCEWGGLLACDAIGVLSMLTSMNGSGSGDLELRRVGRDGEGCF